MVTRRAVCDSPRSWVVSYYQSFNGLRAIAMLAVFTIHYGDLVFPWKRNMPPLWAGVDLFFVLSGFLITKILLDSREDLTFFRVFYARRALRIFPLFYGLVLTAMLLWPILHMTANAYVFTNLIYSSNLFVKGFWLGHYGNPTVIWVPLLKGELKFGHVWSLCVEEQYYLVWPLVVYRMRTRDSLLKLCGIGALCVLCLRVFSYFHSSPQELATHFLYYTTWSRLDALLIGSATAVWLRGTLVTPRALHRVGVWLMTGSVLSILAGFALFGRRYLCDEANPVFETYGYTANALCAAGLLLLSLDQGTRLARVLRTPWLARLGEISYGMYVFHVLPLDVVQHVTKHHLRPHHLQWLGPLGAFAFTWVAAKLSWRYLEQPVLQLKRYFAPVRKPILVSASRAKPSLLPSAVA